MLSYDPITGKVTLIGKLPEEETVPIVTPDQSQAKPKTSPVGGSAPPIRPKNYYLRGETIPEGVETELDMVEEDGRKFLARVPVVPKLSFEDTQRIEAEADKLTLSYGFDPKTGEFGVGLVETEQTKPTAPQIDPMGNPIDGVATGADLAAFDVKKTELGNKLLAAKMSGDEKTYADLVKQSLELDKQASEYEAKNLGDTYYDDYLIKPALAIAGSIVAPVLSEVDLAGGDDFNKLTTGITHVLTRSLGGMAVTGKEEAAAGALAGTAIPGVGTAAGAGIGFLAGTTAYYTGLNINAQAVNRVREMEALYGENFDSIPEADKVKMMSDADAARGVIAGFGETAVDGLLAAAFKPLSKLIRAPKATSIVPKSLFKSPAARRAVGAVGALTGATAVGGLTEGTQSYLEMWGQSVDGGLPDLINDENVRNEVVMSALVGGIIGTSLAGTGIAAKNGGDLAALAARKFTGKSGPETDAGLTVPQPDTNIDGLDKVDTSAFEIEIDGSPVVAPKVVDTTKVNVEPVVDTTPVAFPGKKANNKGKQTGGKKAWDTWNDYYAERVSKFESDLDAKTPTEVYNGAVESGLAPVVAKTFEQVAGPDTNPFDGTPRAKIANNIVKGLDETLETQKFYNNLKNDPEALTTFASAIEASKADPVRQEQIAKVQTVFPNLPDVTVNTLSTKALDTLVENLPDTRGLGQQFHGTKKPIKKLHTFDESQSEKNIYGGGFYTTDALDTAKGYQRKSPEGVVYLVDEKTPVKFYNIDQRIKVTEPFDIDVTRVDEDNYDEYRKADLLVEEGLKELYGTVFGEDLKTVDQESIFADAMRYALKPDGTVSVTDFYDQIREHAAYHNTPAWEVTDILDDFNSSLSKQGYGGITHIGGKFTNTKPHLVKIYFNADAINIEPVNVSRILSLAKKTEDAVIVANPPSDPKALVDNVVKSTAIDDDQLRLPDFLRRAKAVGDTSKLSTTATLTDDTLYSNDPITNIEYVPVINDTLPADLVEDVSRIALDVKGLVEDVAKRLMGGNAGSSITAVVADDIIVERTNKETGKKSYSRAGGEQKNFEDGTRAVIINIGYDIRQKIAGKFTKEDNVDTFETIVHEIVHALDTNKFLTTDMQRVFDKALKEQHKELMKRPDLVDLINGFDLNDPEGRAEILAYTIGDYASRSNNRAAVELRKAYGVDKVNDPSFKEPSSPLLRRIINNILDAIRAIQNKLQEKLDKSFASKRDAERIFDEILSGKFGKAMDKALYQANQRQLGAVLNAKEKQSSKFSMAKLTEHTPSKSTIDAELARAVKRNKEIATEVPDRQLDVMDYIYDGNNTTGWNNQLSSWLSGLGHWRNWAKKDADAAFSSTLVLKREQAQAALHGAWAKSFEEIKKWPDRYELFSIALALKAQDVSLNGDGPVIYTNNNGKRVQLSPVAVDKIRAMSKVFSLPLDFHAQVTRGKMEALARVPAFTTFPAKGTIPEMLGWIKQKRADLKNQVRSSPEERKILGDLADLVDYIKDFEGFKRNGIPYVPEMRSGNWALRVVDKNGDLVGLYTMMAPGGGKPKLKDVIGVHKQLVAKYKNRPDLTITPPDGLFQMTYNNIGKFVKNPSQVDINLVTYLVTQRTMGLIKDKGGMDPAAYKSLQQEALAGDVMSHYKVRGFGKHLLTSRHIDGASTDIDYVISAFSGSSAKSAANYLYGDLVNDTLSAYAIKAAEEGTPQGRKFKKLFNRVSYALNPVSDAPRIRQFQYMWTLGLNPSSGFVQLTPLLGTVPMNLVSIGIPLKAAYSSIKNTMQYLGPTIAKKLGQGRAGEWFSETTLRSLEPMFYKGTKNGKAAFEYALKAALSDSAILNAALPDEARRGSMDRLEGSSKMKLSLGQRTGAILERASEFAGSFMSMMERAARVGTYFGTIKALFMNPDSVKTALDILGKDKSFVEFRKFNPQMDDIRAITNFTIMDSFGNPEKAVRVDYNKGWFGALAAPFSSIPHQLYGTTINNLRGQRGMQGRLAAAYGLAQMAVTFGLNAAAPTLILLTAFILEAMNDEPGELQIKAALVDSFLGTAIKDLTGWSDKTVAEVMYSGFGSYLVNADLSGRMGLAAPLSRQVSEVVKAFTQGNLPELSSVTGIVGQTIGAGVRAADQLSQGRVDVGEALTNIAPAAVRNPLNAIRMAVDYDTGVKKTSLGKEIMRYSEMSTTDLILRGLGFTTNPEKEANLRNRIDALAGASRSSLKTNYKARLIELGGRARAASDPSDAYEYRKEYDRIRKEFYDTVAVIKETDPEEFELHFGGTKLREWERSVKKGEERWADPATQEGLSDIQKSKREKYDRFNRND